MRARRDAALILDNDAPGACTAFEFFAAAGVPAPANVVVELMMVAYEYRAYAAMFAAMPEATRDKVLAAVPGSGFSHEQQINIVTYLFNPAAFSADAYRHWASRPDAHAFVRRVLDGSAIGEIESD